MRCTVLAVAVSLGLTAPAHAGLDAWSMGDQVGGATWQRVPQMDFRAVAGVAIDPSPGEPSYAATTTTG